VIQCSECEFFMRGPAGQLGFKCDPLSTIKEPECLVKWQLMRTNEMGQKLDRLVAAYEATLEIYKRLQPLQEKMFRHMEHEIDETEDADSWKFGLEDEPEEDKLDDDEDDEEDKRRPGPYTP
jgi:hypothetical protein